jgi:hypothetical protein
LLRLQHHHRAGQPDDAAQDDHGRETVRRDRPPVTGAASAATVQFSPAIYGPGSQYQNVDALPAAGATLTMFRGTAAPTSAHSGVNGLAFTKDAFAIVGVKLEMPKNTEPGSFQKQDPEPASRFSTSRCSIRCSAR